MTATLSADRAATAPIEPATEAELAEAIRMARGPLHIRGGGTRGHDGPGTPLSTAGMAGIRLYEPGALTLVAGAGTPMAEIEAALAAEGQRLPFEPMDHRALLGREGTPTIGGVAAANVSGPRRVQAGACRDSMIGIRFVDGSGNIIQNGGRVMKNVTGYDLVRLLAGSHGTLGVLSEVAFKLLPAPETAATLVLEGLSDAQAVQAMAAALGSPFEVTGAAHLPGEGTFLRIEGFFEQVAYRSARLAERLGPWGTARVETDPAQVASRWAGLRDVASFHGKAGDVWRLSVVPSQAPALAARARPRAAAFDWGGGLVWLLMPEGTDLRARLAGLRGHARLERAAPDIRARLGAFPPLPSTVAALQAGLRARFDPRGILNPGLMAA